MNVINSHKLNGIVKVYVLVLLVLSSAMLSRIVTAVGAPKLIDFLHFLIVVIVFTLVCLQKVHRRNLQFFIALTLLLLVIVLSAVVNGAGVANVVLDFLLLSEPFLLLLAIISVPWSRTSIKRFRTFLLAVIFLNVVMVYYQHFIMGLIHDDVQGIFIDMGAGSHLAGAVALTAAFYLLSAFKVWPLWLRAIGAFLCFLVVIFSDTKQAIAVFLVSAVILLVIRTGDLRKMIRYMAILISSIVLVYVVAMTVFPGLTVWSSVDLILEGVQQKLSVFPIIISFYDSGFNWFFGMGPGHTVGRLGWMLPDYYQYLAPLGATTSPVTDAVWFAQQGHYMSSSKTGSSMFSLLFSWSGIWGDLGIIGLVVYLYLWFLVWSRVCLDEISKFFLLTILVFGGVFAWMEEPGYMLFVISIIGLRWQELRSQELSPSRRCKESILSVKGFYENPASS